MNFSSLLPHAPDDLKNRLQRLIYQSLEISTVTKKDLPLWRADFFHVEQSPFWIKLDENQKLRFLTLMAENLLKEAISIEHAGIAYANKMALFAKSQEERQYYTMVANEELNHLYMLAPYFKFSVFTEAPDFSKMIAGFIENEARYESIILIQVLLEGWGIHYYQSLSTGTDNSELKEIFSRIVFDETRHHGGGIILSQSFGIQLSGHFSTGLLSSIQAIINAIRLGPFQVAIVLVKLNRLSSNEDIKSLLLSIQAIETTKTKLKLVQQTLGKVLTSEQLGLIEWQPYSIEEMTQAILNSVDNLKYDDPSKESLL